MTYALPENAATIETPPLELPRRDALRHWFDGPRSEQSFGADLGLGQGPSFQPAEVRRVRELIKAHMLRTAQEVSPQAVEMLSQTELERFHAIEGYDHARMLSKRGRILPASSVEEIKSMSFFGFVQQLFGEFQLADEEDVGHEQITFRLVRPGRQEDVGSLHCDSWFWDHYGTRLEDGMCRAKVWVPICVEPELNGLRLAPGSHRSPRHYTVKPGPGKVEFVPGFDIHEIGLRQYCGDVGQPILFNYRTLHVGALNRGRNSRISIETTILYRSECK
ncbi:MAG: phytanoyl-CoA dioxygenase family protein [Phenylobacterium sp.]|uniref:phytanoyl-CoA dioxygenase family protein n=1 Tax=Phenylobacterium sp. TaxID=1871053 RepID=UPI0027364FA1|nr:phytanoyl-CoA dioxygenase family protein [Phenylobacterium sp.]MDP3746745.1 phytanoyl-CoA dioxygenase family protein [Phenylobacterium sp.]